MTNSNLFIRAYILFQPYICIYILNIFILYILFIFYKNTKLIYNTFSLMTYRDISKYFYIYCF